MARLTGQHLEAARQHGWNYVQHRLLEPTGKDRVLRKISRTGSASEAGLVAPRRVLPRSLTAEQMALVKALV